MRSSAVNEASYRDIRTDLRLGHNIYQELQFWRREINRRTGYSRWAARNGTCRIRLIKDNITLFRIQSGLPIEIKDFFVRFLILWRVQKSKIRFSSLSSFVVVNITGISQKISQTISQKSENTFERYKK